MLLCLQDPEELQIWGNFDTRVVQNLRVMFTPCRNETESGQAESGLVCKSREEIDKWQFGKTIAMLVNHNEFIEYEFTEEAMQKESMVIRQSLTPRSPTEYTWTLFRSLVTMNDSLMGLNIFSSKKDGFYLRSRQHREINVDAIPQTVVNFELSRTQINYTRQVNTILDFLASLGGLFSAC